MPFPASVNSRSEQDEGYIYSAGVAHRDWKTLVEALLSLEYRAILSTTVPLEIPDHAKERITVLPLQSPEEGRKLLSKSRLVVMSLEETELPSGPLVLLDAMSVGKPVVATNVNGTRDYVVDGKTALVVPPKDATADGKSDYNLNGK